MSTLRVLVYGASGKQGGSVARRLVERGHRVTTIVRDPASTRLDALRAAGVEVAPGDLHDAASIARAAAGHDAVFAMTTPFERGPGAEVAQGRALIEAARAAQVSHVVFSSVAGADRGTGVPHFDSKYEVERMLRAADVPHSVVAPVYFMENLFFPHQVAALKAGVYSQALPPERKLQQIAVSDIGMIAVHILENRDAFLGERFDVAGDDLSGSEQAAILSRQLGRSIRYEAQPLEDLRAFNHEMAVMYEWFDRVGYNADIGALRRTFSGLRTFASWLGGQDLASLA